MARTKQNGGPQMVIESTLAAWWQPRVAYTARSFAARCLAFAYCHVHEPRSTGSGVLLQGELRNGVAIHPACVRSGSLLGGHGTE